MNFFNGFSTSESPETSCAVVLKFRPSWIITVVKNNCSACKIKLSTQSFFTKLMKTNDNSKVTKKQRNRKNSFSQKLERLQIPLVVWRKFSLSLHVHCIYKCLIFCLCLQYITEITIKRKTENYYVDISLLQIVTT